MMKYFVPRTEESVIMAVKVCMSLSKAMEDLFVIWKALFANREKMGYRWTRLAGRLI